MINMMGTGNRSHPYRKGESVMARFVAFDVETPNRQNNRMSAIGICVIEDGRIAGSWYSLVNPEQPFDWYNTVLTGIDSSDVAEAPTFPMIWEKIEPVMSSGILVAHNASFDIGVLKKCLADYGISWQEQVPGLCTVRMGRRLLPGISHKLDALCDYYGICLNHHQADSDSRACAEILLRYLEAGADPDAFVRSYQLR